jgi:hypothetical protein
MLTKKTTSKFNRTFQKTKIPQRGVTASYPFNLKYSQFEKTSPYKIKIVPNSL